ncbi:MAG: hypothetical protein ABW123_28685, partial [Cystobacter sp.]
GQPGIPASCLAGQFSASWPAFPQGLPSFDGPAALGRLVDARRGGFFRVGPVGRFHASRR